LLLLLPLLLLPGGGDPG